LDDEVRCDILSRMIILTTSKTTEGYSYTAAAPGHEAVTTSNYTEATALLRELGIEHAAVLVREAIKSGKVEIPEPEHPVESGAESVDEHEQRIQERARELWDAEGRPEGRDEEYWLRAEQLIGDRTEAPHPVEARHNRA
jgi:hypothetical protein